MANGHIVSSLVDLLLRYSFFSFATQDRAPLDSTGLDSTLMQHSRQPRKARHGKTPSHLPGTAPFLRILFPRYIQQREPVPQLLNSPHPDLDAEAYHFLALLVRDFIQTWYSSFSSDPQFVATIVNVVIHIARELERRSQEVDWVGLLLQDVPAVLQRHYMDYRQAAQKCETAYAPNQTIESIFHGLQPHFALSDNEESEKEYLRQIADELLKALLPDSEYQSDCVRWLVREILCCLVLRSLVEILTEPDMINYIVNTLLASFEPEDEAYESFLQNAADDVAKSNANFTKFLSGLGPKSSIRSKLTHRSSTPNIKTTDEMVNMLQEAQASVLETSQHPSENPRLLARPERNDDLLSQRISSGDHPAQPTPLSSRRRVSISPQHIPPLESFPESIPQPSSDSTNSVALGCETIFEHNTLDGRNITRPAPSFVSITSTPSEPPPPNHPHGPPSMPSRIRSNIKWALTEAPVDYSSYLVNCVLIPFGALLVTIFTLLQSLPSKINKGSKALVWIYAELEAPEHTELEAGIFGLLKEVFYLEERNQVVWRQWEIMGWPLVRALGGGAIDRLLAQGVHWIFAERQLVYYIQAGRRALWPDPNSSLPRPRGVHEMEMARKETERKILRAIPGPLRDMFFGDQGVHHLAAAQEALEPFQNKVCNKHLMYIALDLLLSKLVPEVYPEPGAT